MAKVDHSEKVVKLYQYGTLECLVRLVEGISRDFRETDDIYQNLGTTARRALRKSVGRALTWENAEEREQLFNRLLTRSDVNAEEPTPAGFPLLSRNLREAAREWGTRRELAVGQAYLAEVEDRALSLREYLEQKCQGQAASLKDADETFKPMFDGAVRLLKDRTVIGSFSGAGNGPSRPDKWPYVGDDGGSVRLVNAIVDRLSARDLLDAETVRLLESGLFSSILQMAFKGSQVLELVLGENWNKRLEEIAQRAFEWERYHSDLNPQSGARETSALTRTQVAA